MPNSNKIILLLVLGHCLIKGLLATVLLVRLHRIDAKNRLYHQAQADKQTDAGK